MSSRPANGGVVSLQQLRQMVAARRRASVDSITEDDCIRAIKTLKASGCGTGSSCMWSAAGLRHSDDTVTVCGSTTIQVAGCLEGAACTKSNTIGPSQPALAGGLQVTAPCSQTLCDDCTVMMSRTAC